MRYVIPDPASEDRHHVHSVAPEGGVVEVTWFFKWPRVEPCSSALLAIKIIAIKAFWIWAEGRFDHETLTNLTAVKHPPASPRPALNHRSHPFHRRLRVITLHEMRATQQHD